MLAYSQSIGWTMLLMCNVLMGHIWFMDKVHSNMELSWPTLDIPLFLILVRYEYLTKFYFQYHKCHARTFIYLGNYILVS